MAIQLISPLEKIVWQTMGEHSLTFQGPQGLIEANLTVPENALLDYCAVLGHPHSLQGGTMQNKVVTTMSRMFKELRIPSLRFNFRGVGASGGVYDAGAGESEDMQALANVCQQMYPNAALCFAGFSFGSYVAYRAASQLEHAVLILIAPPTHHYDYTQTAIDPKKTILVQGELDEVSLPNLVHEYAQKTGATLLSFPNAGHFFHGELISLKTRLSETVADRLKLR